MRDVLSTIFEPQQLTNPEHAPIATLLITLGLLSAIVWASVLVSLTVRHLAVLSLRISFRARRRQLLHSIGKLLW